MRHLGDAAMTDLNALGLKVGDPIRLPPLGVRWWQFWKRWPFRRSRRYRVTGVTANTIVLDQPSACDLGRGQEP